MAVMIAVYLKLTHLRILDLRRHLLQPLHKRRRHPRRLCVGSMSGRVISSKVR